MLQIAQWLFDKAIIIITVRNIDVLDPGNYNNNEI